MDKEYAERVLAGFLTRTVFERLIKLLREEMQKPQDAILVMKYLDALKLWEILEHKKKNNFLCEMLGENVL